ncbi:nucleoside/nucleotide kinase family protein [Leifsonia kafniensis]|uniref:Nucleoside/nucleotide kinase family protein n=1 Tax=Leifsonia kafniensis TaxID=475957 RepID=A0ABP7KGX1_9MICO
MSTLGSLDEIVRVVENATIGRRRTMVGIAGSPGSGKSTIAAALMERLRGGKHAVLLPMDGFHLPQSTLVQLGRRERMGAPDTFDVDGFVDVLTAVRFTTEPVSVPGFDRAIEEPIPDALTVFPDSSVVVIEGNYLLHDAGGWERVLPLLDVSMFVDLPQDIRVERLITRHEEFGKSPAAALAWSTGPDERNAELIEATAVRAGYRIRLEL